MKVRLILERRGKRAWTTELRGPEATIGRSLGNTIRIPSSEVSRLHCRLRVENDVVTIEDLESINGTFLNGARVRDVQVVRPGDRLSVGPATLLVEYQLTPEALQRLRGEDEVVVLEADDEIEIVADASVVQPVEVLQDMLPTAEPIAEDALPTAKAIEDDGADMFIFDEEEGGEALDFIIEPEDDTNERRKTGPGH